METPVEHTLEHVVFFPAPDGTPAFRRFAGLEEAVRFVEHLRNVENVSGASVHALTEVPLSFKAWYRVELPGQDVAEPAANSETAAPVELARPATIADAIETYSAAAPAGPFELPELPEPGSATGIVVPDQPFVAVDQFAGPQPVGSQPAGPQTAGPHPAGPQQAAPVVAASAPFAAPAPADAPPPADAPRTDGEQAQVLEPAFGARRERSLGFFTR